MKALLYLILPPTLALAACSDLPGVAPPGSPNTEVTHSGHSHGPTAKPKTPKQGIKPYPLKTCVVTDEGLDDWDEQTTYIHGDQEMKFCCKMCLKKFKKNPNNYLTKLP